MEIVARNLHEQATEQQVEAFFRETLARLDIHTFHCHRPKGRLAILTIHDLQKAHKFLALHGQTTPGAAGFRTVKQKLFRMEKPVNCSVSNKQPDPLLLLSLKKEESDRYAAKSRKPKIVPGKLDANQSMPAERRRAFDISSFKCGQWTYVRTDLKFATYYREKTHGRIVFGQRTLLVTIGQQSQGSKVYQVEIPYNTIQSFTVGPKLEPSLTFTLSEAPKFYEKLGAESDPNNLQQKLLEQMLQSMTIGQRSQQSQHFKRKRLTAISQSHEIVVSSCLCYRLRLSNADDIVSIQNLKHVSAIPASISWTTSTVHKTPFPNQMGALKSALNGVQYGNMPFELKFQMQKLAQNGYLGPNRVIKLLEVVSRQLASTSVAIAVQSVRNLMSDLPFPGPHTEAAELSTDTLTDCLLQNQEAIRLGESYPRHLSDQYDHIIDVHKAMVTPAGIYLYGPEPEIKNRVLRKYGAFPTYFLSVSFLDEDGEPIRFDRHTSSEDIYQVRYRKVLQTGINISDRQYEVSPGYQHHKTL